MRGHTQVIAMRRKGYAPSAVWLYDTPPDAPRESQRFAWPAFGQSADVSIEADENPGRLDLRFVVGLRVHVMAADEQRLQAITEQAMECGAKRVLGTLTQGSGDAAKCIALTDTEGAFEWRN